MGQRCGGGEALSFRRQTVDVEQKREGRALCNFPGYLKWRSPILE